MKKFLVISAIALATFSAFCAGTKKFGKMKDYDWVVTNAWQAMQHRVKPDSGWATNHFESAEFSNAVGKVQRKVDIPVKSVNGKTGDVILNAADVHALPDTYTPPPETDPTVPAWAKQPNPPEGMPDNALVLTNGEVKTANGSKTIDAADVGALPTTGGTMTGDLTIKDNTAIRFKTYDPDFDAGIYIDEAEIRLGDAHTAMVLDALTAFYLNTKTTYGYEGIYFNGQRVAIENWQSLSKMLDNANANNLATNQTFSNAVLAVGLNIDTNSVAVLNEIADTFGGFPIEGTATTVGGLLAALAAAIAWLKKNKVGSFDSVGGATATVENGVAKLDNFFTESNSLLTGTIESKVNSMFDNGDTTSYPRPTEG